MTEIYVPPLEAKAYLILERERYGMRIAEMRKNKPALRSGQVAVRVMLKVDRKMFDTFIPEVTAVLEQGNIIEPEVSVEDNFE